MSLVKFSRKIPKHLLGGGGGLEGVYKMPTEDIQGGGE